MTAGALTGWTVSLDLWGTLIEHTDPGAVADWRITEFSRIFGAFEHSRTPEMIRAAVTRTDQDVLTRQRHHGVQPALPDMLAAILKQLHIPALAPMLQVLAVVHTHAALRGCPQPITGATQALAELTATGARIVLTSNTLATSAEVHRQLVDDLGLTPYFDDLLFSGELGVAKPHPGVFAAIAARAGCPTERICHVGDDRRTDVDGAHRAGCLAVHYQPSGRGAADTPAITHLDQLAAAVTTMCQAAAPTAPAELS